MNETTKYQVIDERNGCVMAESGYRQIAIANARKISLTSVFPMRVIRVETIITTIGFVIK